MPRTYRSSSDNPQEAQEALASALAATTTTAAPQVPPVPLPNTDGYVSLPGGLITQEGAVLRDAEVRELTGAHEEAITKAQRGRQYSRFVKMLLRCGVVSIGDQAPDDTAVNNLLIGDRDALILGIRRATYGDDVLYPDVTCPSCEDVADLTLHLDDIPVRTLELPTERTFEVPLRKGGHVLVRLPTGADQDAIFDDPNLTVPEQNSVLLSRCVISITGTDEITRPVTHVGPVRDMGLVDRSKILEEIGKRQPGPRYDEVSHVCENCGKEYPVVVTVGDLFFR